MEHIIYKKHEFTKRQFRDSLIKDNNQVQKCLNIWNRKYLYH